MKSEKYTNEILQEKRDESAKKIEAKIDALESEIKEIQNQIKFYEDQIFSSENIVLGKKLTPEQDKLIRDMIFLKEFVLPRKNREYEYACRKYKKVLSENSLEVQMGE